MIYLSRLWLEPRSRQVQNELRSPYEMHRTLSHAFPTLSKEEWEAARVLFRVDEEKGALALLVQSKAAPDWAAFATRLHGVYLCGEPQMKAWEPRFQANRRLRFRLQANPTMAVSGGKEQKRGVRRGLYREAERLDWLRSQGERCGFALPTYTETLCGTEERPVVFRGREHKDDLVLELPVAQVQDLNDGRRFPIPQRAHQFSAVRFDGELVVTEPEKLQEAVSNGIGKARGFGFGLLSVAPATS